MEAINSETHPGKAHIRNQATRNLAAGWIGGRTDFQGGCYLTMNSNYHAGRFYTIAGHVLRSLPQLPYFKTCDKSAEAIVVCKFAGYIYIGFS